MKNKFIHIEFYCKICGYELSIEQDIHSTKVVYIGHFKQHHRCSLLCHNCGWHIDGENLVRKEMDSAIIEMMNTGRL